MDDEMPAETGMVPGRTCGPCMVCCIAPTIDDPELQKLPGHPCPNLGRAGCGIYPSRPRTCRAFHCGWLSARWIGETLRPDKSGVLVVLNTKPDANGVPERTASFALLTRAALNAPGLAEAVAAAVAGKVGAYMLIPGAPGFTATQVRLNERLADPVGRKDKAGVLRVLKQVRAEARTAASRPVVFAGRDQGTDNLKAGVPA
jgi:hypothetical protein